MHGCSSRVEIRAAARRFCLVLVKPSHYDDDGYVIQWLPLVDPVELARLAVRPRQATARERRVLGDDVEIEIHAFDETNTRVRPARLAAMIEAAGAGMVMLTGVQSNQFPRALDLARPLRERGIAGRHRRIPRFRHDQHARRAGPRPRAGPGALGLSLFAGEAEGRLDEVLRDAAAGALKPLYNFMDDLPGIEGTPIPLMAVERAQRTAGGDDQLRRRPRLPLPVLFLHDHQRAGAQVAPALGRRRREDRARQLRAGTARFFITDDNFARNKDWEPILDRLIHLREVEGLNISFIIQVDTLCHRLPNFIEKCARAGVRRVFIGLENINPANLAGAKKRQNKITEYRKMLLAWKQARVITYAGYILGFPNDTVESILHDIDVIKKELPVDLLEFFYLTPLPGSEDHLKLFRAGAPLDADMNKYDLNHICTTHPRMSPEEWDARLSARLGALLHPRSRRDGAAARGGDRRQHEQRAVPDHMVQGQHRVRENPSARKRVPAAEIPPRPAAQLSRSSRHGGSIRATSGETAVKLVKWGALYLRLRRIYLSIQRDPQPLRLHRSGDDAR